MQVISLSSLIEASNSSEELQEYLSTFQCKKNSDVETFLHDKAIENECASRSRTNLVVDEDNDNEIIGYFTILIKDFNFTTASGESRRKLTGNKKAQAFPTILIAQLGRADKYKGKVSGSEILHLALGNCQLIHNLSALRVVCVEYDDTEYLKRFYPENGFKELQLNENGFIISCLRL